MPPKKRKSVVDDLVERVERLEPTVEISPDRRVTRSLTRGELKPKTPSDYSAVAAEREGKKPKTTAEPEESEEEKPEVDDSAQPAAAAADADASGSAATTIIIEHCKQCRSFSQRANEVRAGLKKDLPDIKVVINPEKPRRGCFEIRQEGEDGQIFISLLDMKRPFKPMKDLNMEEVVADIVNKIQD